MPMQMGFRWYGEGNDQISLDYIKQIPGVSTIVWALHHKMPGEIWEEHEIAEVMDQHTSTASTATLSSPSTFMTTSRSASPPAMP